MTPRRQTYVRGGAQQIRKHKPDYVLLVLASLLLGLGVVLMVAISPALTAQKNVPGSYFVFRQLVAMSIGLALFFICSKLTEHFFRITQRFFVITSIISAGLVLAISGVAFRWIQIGGFSFQPAELMKFTVVIVTAIFLSDRITNHELSNFRKTVYPLLGWFLFLGFILVVLERDLGSMIVMLAIVFTMLLMANFSKKQLFIGFLLALGAVVLAVTSTQYRRDRFMTFLQPERDCSTTGYHACQALIAVGSGGLFGLGLGHSVQAYGYLPEASNDSIFAIYSEKFGFIGNLVLISLYGALLYRLLYTLKRTEDLFYRLVVSGVFAWFLSQAFINIGAMIGILPLKGITLPFISYGGSSLMFVLASLGLIFRASQYTLIRKAR